MQEKYLICSQCFINEGLKRTAELLGVLTTTKCPNCNSCSGYKLTHNILNDLCYEFFVRGTFIKCDYGGAPRIQFNEYHYEASQPEFFFIDQDVKLIQQILKVGFFEYGPRLWMLGHIEPLDKLQDNNLRNNVFKDIINQYPIRCLDIDSILYRLRVNPKIKNDIYQYDSPPDELLGAGIFDDKWFPVFYASQNLDICLYECRVKAQDEIFIATISTIKPLKLLDLSAAIIEKGITEFESLDLAIRFLFSADNVSYQICKELAQYLNTYSIDGIIYPSYFSYLYSGNESVQNVYGAVPNLALFGRPIYEGKVIVKCINRVLINKVKYHVTFGPV